MGIERLGHLIEVAIEGNNWEPIRLSRNGPSISYLFFADDLLLFCRASEFGAACLNRSIDIFWHFTSYRVNKQKTQLFFSANVNTGIAQKIYGTLEFTRVSNLGIYLGMPLFHGHVGVNTS